MPLTRQNVTVASRVMLPTYVAFFLGVGLSLSLTPQDRLRLTPSFAYADRVVDLRLWGVGFLAVAVFLALAMLMRSRSAYRAGLSVACLWMAVWAIVLALSAFDASASFSAWTWPAFVALACYATLRSLSEGER